MLSAGAPRHGRNLRRQWQSVSDSAGWGWELEFLEWQRDGYAGYAFDIYDWCVWVGCFERVFELMRSIETPRHVALWVGTDILQHQELVRRGYDDPFGAAAIHVADAPHLVQEAAQITGRPVGYVRSIPPAVRAGVEIRRWDRVLCYVPIGREGFFRYPWIREIAADFPGLGFEVLRPGLGAAAVEGNVNEHPELDGDGLLRVMVDCFVLLRPCEHDGVGLTLVEMAQLGRHVVHSDGRIPHALSGRSVGEIEFRLDDLLARKAPPPPEVGEYYRNEYTERRLEEDLGRIRGQLEGDVHAEH